MNIKVIKERDPLAEAFAKSIQSLDSQVEIRKLSIVEELLQFMKRQGINRSELAERMGVGPSRVTKMLSGDSNLTIDTLVRAGRAVGADLAQTFIPHGQKGHWVASSTVKSSGENYITVDFAPKKQAQANAPTLGTQKPASKDADAAA
jgi:transcriptional regulator with XRE-family HTH domain